MKTMIRRSFLTVLLTAAAFSAGAQDIYDAFSLSENHYGGTARSIGLGNAMTAVGGDLGSLTLNPAGSAVAGYSQFTITPNISVSTITSQGDEYGLSDKIKTNHTRFNLYNIGATIDYNTGNLYGIKRYSFGFVANSSQNYLSDLFASGINNQTSFMGYYADASNGFSSADLNLRSAFQDYSPAYWHSILAYQSGMIATNNADANEYIAASEVVYPDGTIGVGGDLDQIFGRQILGSKTDLLFNVAVNVNDILYLGANLGLVTASYRRDFYIQETAVNDNDFALDFGAEGIKYFNRGRIREALNWDASGVYAKIGAILTPGAGFRIGAAIQTPTAMTVNERYSMSGFTRYRGGDGDAECYSPTNEYSFGVKNPYRYNFGVAWTLGNVLLLSADYEACDYSTMRLRSADNWPADTNLYAGENQEIRKSFGVSQMLRAGLEVKPVPAIALRVGYNLTTSPELTGDGKYVDADRTSVALGLGYSSNGSFFADFALRGAFWEDYVLPYGNNYENAPDVLCPEIHNDRSLWDFTCTFGWRF